MKGPSLTLHAEEEQLLRYLDGELPAQASAGVRSHLEACWQCRAALEELQNVVSECVHYRANVLQRHLPTPPAPWVDIYREFDAIDASVEPVIFGRIAQLLRVPVDRPTRMGALAAMTLLIVFGLFYRYRQAPSVQAAELLQKAVISANAHPAKPRRIQIRTRDRRFMRPAVAVQKTAIAAADTDTLQAMFVRANYDWNDPLSARSFQAWRNQLTGKSDRVVQADQSYRIETSTAASELRQATMTLRAADLRPVEERFEFSNQEWVEITEVADEAAPPASTVTADESRHQNDVAKAPANQASNQPIGAARPASAADELQVVAALHDVGADLGDPVEVSRSGGEVLVNGVGIAPPRQQEIKDALSSKAHVVVRFSDPLPAAGEQRTIAPGDNSTSGDARSLQARLADQLGGRANLDQLSAQVLDSSESLMARAYALRRLAEQFPTSAERELNAADRQLLLRLRTEHSAALRQQAAEIGRELQPILATVNGSADTSPDYGVPSEPWQAATENLFQSARRLDKLLGVMFGAAPNETPGEQLPAQLKTSLAQLRSTLDHYERSNK